MVYFKDEINDFIVDDNFYEDISYSMLDDKKDDELEEKEEQSKLLRSFQ